MWQGLSEEDQQPVVFREQQRSLQRCQEAVDMLECTQMKNNINTHTHTHLYLQFTYFHLKRDRPDKVVQLT